MVYGFVDETVADRADPLIAKATRFAELPIALTIPKSQANTDW